MNGQTNTGYVLLNNEEENGNNARDIGGENLLALKATHIILNI